jgi:hypothetical protein
MIMLVKIVQQVKLLPDAPQAAALERTLPTINQAANWVSTVAFERFGLRASVRDLRKRCYGDLRARGFGAQAAQHIIKRVVDAYATLRANIRGGNLGGPQSKRRRKAESKALAFRPDAAHTYDDRNPVVELRHAKGEHLDPWRPDQERPVRLFPRHAQATDRAPQRRVRPGLP